MRHNQEIFPQPQPEPTLPQLKQELAEVLQALTKKERGAVSPDIFTQVATLIKTIWERVRYQHAHHPTAVLYRALAAAIPRTVDRAFMLEAARRWYESGGGDEEAAHILIARITRQVVASLTQRSDQLDQADQVLAEIVSEVVANTLHDLQMRPVSEEQTEIARLQEVSARTSRQLTEAVRQVQERLEQEEQLTAVEQPEVSPLEQVETAVYLEQLLEELLGRDDFDTPRAAQILLQTYGALGFPEAENDAELASDWDVSGARVAAIRKHVSRVLRGMIERHRQAEARGERLQRFPEHALLSTVIAHPGLIRYLSSKWGIQIISSLSHFDLAHFRANVPLYVQRKILSALASRFAREAAPDPALSKLQRWYKTLVKLDAAGEPTRKPVLHSHLVRVPDLLLSPQLEKKLWEQRVYQLGHLHEESLPGVGEFLTPAEREELREALQLFVRSFAPHPYLLRLYRLSELL